MRRSVQTVMAALAVSVAMLVACTPEDPGPPPSGSPVLESSTAPTSEVPPTTSSPTPTASPTPTTQSQEEKDIAAAMKAVVEANRIIDEVLMEPDKHKTYPKELEKYVDPASPYWDFQVFALDAYRRDGERFNMATTINSMFLVGDYDPEELVIYHCIDARDVKILNKKDEVVITGNITAAHVIVRKHGGAWRLWEYEENSDGDFSWEVASCEEGI